MSASTIPMITLEEHFMSRACAAAYASSGGDPLDSMPATVTSALLEVGPQRLAAMDATNVRVQVISHVPAQNVSPSTLSAANDELAAHISSAPPGRFRGFAILPMAFPELAAAELERCVRQHGFAGALIDNHTNGRFYDGREYDVFWGRAQELGVPVYPHPTWPSEGMERELYTGGGVGAAGGVRSVSLGAFGWGWHAETGLHFLRLVAAGVFDRFPRLRLVLGHSGELVPYMFDRIRHVSRMWAVARPFEAVMRENVWVTTSGMFDTASLRCLLANMPRDRVLLSVDYPFSANEKGRAYLEQIEREGVLVGEELRAFACGNAEKLLGIQMP